MPSRIFAFEELMSLYIMVLLSGLLVGCSGNNVTLRPSTSPSAPQSGLPPASHFLATDQEILANLKHKLKLVPLDKGGAGRCLFHSLREQISQLELQNVSGAWDLAIRQDINNYDGLTGDGKADLLRKIAIFEERDFLETKNNKDKQFSELSKENQAWALEMAKDWYEEFVGRDQTRIWYQENIKTPAGREIMWQYVIANRNGYWANTGCETNWAGSSEAIVFARALRRPLRMYGLDKVSSNEGARLDTQGIVLPYAEYDFGYGGKPLLIWQVSGGGHYQMLVTN
jgi:hypothetical protein